MDKSIFLGVFRHVLTFGGGYIVSKGLLDAGLLDQTIAAVMTLVGVIWSVADKKPATPAE